ncbi:MAG: hypothetical protein DDT27_00095 [Dehalococcoidia bacterium]|nr:hypothetical protein [Chloroflexota bacterium]
MPPRILDARLKVATSALLSPGSRCCTLAHMGLEQGFRGLCIATFDMLDKIHFHCLDLRYAIGGQKVPFSSDYTSLMACLRRSCLKPKNLTEI